jgi:hypothetical protein
MSFFTNLSTFEIQVRYYILFTYLIGFIAFYIKVAIGLNMKKYDVFRLLVAPISMPYLVILVAISKIIDLDDEI